MECSWLGPLSKHRSGVYFASNRPPTQPLKGNDAAGGSLDRGQNNPETWSAFFVGELEQEGEEAFAYNITACKPGRRNREPLSTVM